jgi:isopropylmalate/homocitrate/citramalate synthase
MKTEAENKRSRAQAPKPKPELVDVGGRTYRTGILANDMVYPALEPLPEGLKLEAEFLAKLEDDRIEASDAADDEALGPKTLTRKIGVMYSADNREVRSYERYVQREKRRLQAEAEQDDEIVKEAQRYVDMADNPEMAEALAAKAREEREQTAMELKLRTEALERDQAEAVRIANALGADRVVIQDGVEVLLPEEPLENEL